MFATYQAAPSGQVFLSDRADFALANDPDLEQRLLAALAKLADRGSAHVIRAFVDYAADHGCLWELLGCLDCAEWRIEDALTAQGTR